MFHGFRMPERALVEAPGTATTGPHRHADAGDSHGPGFGARSRQGRSVPAPHPALTATTVPSGTLGQEGRNAPARMLLSPLHMRGAPALVGALVVLAASTGTPSAYASDPPRPAPEPVNAPTAEPDSGFMIGATLSYFSPFVPASWAPPLLAAGPAIGLRAGYRWRFLYAGAAYQHVFFGGGTYAQDVETFRTLSASSDYGGLDLVAITSPDALVAAFFRIGAGVRFIQVRSDSTPGTTTTSNFDLTLLGIGAQINVGGWLRVVPEISFEVGPLNAYTSLSVTTYFDFTRRSR